MFSTTVDEPPPEECYLINDEQQSPGTINSGTV